MRVVFLSPRYPTEMRHFTRGLAEVGAEVLGVGDGSPDPELRRYLSDYLEVPSLFDEADVIRRVRGWLRGRSIDRVAALCRSSSVSRPLAVRLLCASRVDSDADRKAIAAEAGCISTGGVGG